MKGFRGPEKGLSNNMILICCCVHLMSGVAAEDDCLSDDMMTVNRLFKLIIPLYSIF